MYPYYCIPYSGDSVGEMISISQPHFIANKDRRLLKIAKYRNANRYMWVLLLDATVDDTPISPVCSSDDDGLGKPEMISGVVDRSWVYSVKEVSSSGRVCYYDTFNYSNSLNFMSDTPLYNTRGEAIAAMDDGKWDTVYAPYLPIGISPEWRFIGNLIIINGIDGINLIPNLFFAEEGEVVTVDIRAENGYNFNWELLSLVSNGSSVPFVKESNTRFHFTMPAFNVTITPSASISAYTITINTAEHGFASSSVSSADEGDIVTVTLTPDSGYGADVQNTTITSTIGVLPVWDTATQFHFTMPAANVTIQPAFKEIYVPSGYQISVTTVEHGWAEVDKAIDVPGGETITVTFHPDEGYGVDRSVTQVTSGAGPITISWVNQVEATFVTPSPTPTLGNIIITPAFTESDPYLPGGTSGVGGGGGDFDDHSDPVPIPALPTISVVNSGLVTLFRPSNDQLVSLGRTLWTSWDDFGTNLQHIFSNPMDYFIAFNILPCIPDVGTERRIKLGLWESSVSMPPVLSQWYDFDFGQLVVKPYSNTALDYAPNTKITAMLPYIGSVTLNTDEIMGQTLNLRYRIDLLSGSCVAMITVNASVYYQFTGECSVSIPLTGADYSRIYSAVIGAIGTAITGGVAAAGAGAAAGGATTAIAAGNSIARNSEAAASAGAAFSNVTKGVKGAPAMRQLMMEAAQNAVNAGANLAEAPTKVSRGVQAARIANTVNNTVSQVMSGKQLAQHSGTISGSAGMLGTRAAYLMIEYPNQALPEKYRHFVGYPSGMYAKLRNLTGYTECEQVLAAGITGTDEEYAELVECLKGGVYL